MLLVDEHQYAAVEDCCTEESDVDEWSKDRFKAVEEEESRAAWPGVQSLV